MTDPLGLIGNLSPTRDIVGPGGALPIGPNAKPTDGPSFKELMHQQLNEVNRLQRDAKEAVEDLAAGRRDDVESVILATQKADNAFRMLQAVRNKVVDAIGELKQMRV